eukprot:CAMPEP_0184700748 /NCGR_PEP_ID=MMETSP0313-20130426/15833_1 /TAXON_ID=2792 /ORGANISM="Porphyridium aerugineum, Strain SAG 1380-2" /LENGTH=220 /DNA_ID=CAMNT_0027160557 /DNA_START=32 /DNA_END=691 /DNA_ORIENTATION=+
MPSDMETVFSAMICQPHLRRAAKLRFAVWIAICLVLLACLVHITNATNPDPDDDENPQPPQPNTQALNLSKKQVERVKRWTKMQINRVPLGHTLARKRSGMPAQTQFLFIYLKPMDSQQEGHDFSNSARMMLRNNGILVLSFYNPAEHAVALGSYKEDELFLAMEIMLKMDSVTKCKFLEAEFTRKDLKEIMRGGMGDDNDSDESDSSSSSSSSSSDNDE